MNDCNDPLTIVHTASTTKLHKRASRKEGKKIKEKKRWATVSEKEKKTDKRAKQASHRAKQSTTATAPKREQDRYNK